MVLGYFIANRCINELLLWWVKYNVNYYTNEINNYNVHIVLQYIVVHNLKC